MLSVLVPSLVYGGGLGWGLVFALRSWYYFCAPLRFLPISPLLRTHHTLRLSAIMKPSTKSPHEDCAAPFMALKITPEQEIWVMTGEGSAITGYNALYLQKMARKNLKLPEDERLFKVRMRAKRYEIWLPDLLRYIEEVGNGPHQDKK